MGAVVLFELDNFCDTEVTFKILHVAGIGSSECINALVIITYHEHGGLITSQ